MRRSIIAFTGKKGSGKDTAASFLVEEYGFHRLAFADPLKEVCRIVFGLTNAELYDPMTKQATLRRWPYQSPREIMQLVGTECFRNLWPDVWIEAFKREAEKHERIVVTDCRFLNEAATVRLMGGWIIRVNRPQADAVYDAHASERELEQIIYDRAVINDASLADLRQRTLQAVEGWI